MYDFSKGPVKFIRGGKYPFCHSVLVDDRVRAVIDASSDEEKLKAFKRQGRVDYLITSHAHEDHLFFNYLFPESKFCAHLFDAPLFNHLDSLIDSYGDMSSQELDRWRKFLRQECHYQERKVDLLLEDRAVLEMGDVRVEVIHTPGHTRGHLAFYFPEEKILFTGDLDLTKAGPYYADRASSVEDIIRSLKRLKTYPAEVYLTAHGKGIFHGDPALIDQYLAIVLSREESVIEILKAGPKTLDQVVEEGIIYGKNPKTIGAWDLSLSERGMMIKHLDHLIRHSRVRKDADFFHFLT
jgi:glyoxylase-like metal-dependent hydrolase (beta-lactamase superfamily II)